MAIPLGKRRPGTSPRLANMQTRWERETHTHKRDHAMRGRLQGKEKKSKYVRYETVFASPPTWSPENSLGLQMQVFPMLPRQDYFMEAPDIAFILP